MGRMGTCDTAWSNGAARGLVPSPTPAAHHPPGSREPVPGVLLPTAASSLLPPRSGTLGKSEIPPPREPMQSEGVGEAWAAV